MLGAVGNEIKIGDVITYGQRQGNGGGVQIALVTALDENKLDISVLVPSEKFKVYYATPNRKWHDGAAVAGTSNEHRTRKTKFPYPQRVTVTNRDEAWWRERFKIGQTTYRKSTSKYDSVVVNSLEEVLA